MQWTTLTLTREKERIYFLVIPLVFNAKVSGNLYLSPLCSGSEAIYCTCEQSIHYFNISPKKNKFPVELFPNENKIMFHLPLSQAFVRRTVTSFLRIDDYITFPLFQDTGRLYRFILLDHFNKSLD